MILNAKTPGYLYSGVSSVVDISRMDVLGGMNFEIYTISTPYPRESMVDIRDVRPCYEVRIYPTGNHQDLYVTIEGGVESQ